MSLEIPALDWCPHDLRCAREYLASRPSGFRLLVDDTLLEILAHLSIPEARVFRLVSKEVCKAVDQHTDHAVQPGTRIWLRALPGTISRVPSALYLWC